MSQTALSYATEYRLSGARLNTESSRTPDAANNRQTSVTYSLDLNVPDNYFLTYSADCFAIGERMRLQPRYFIFFALVASAGVSFAGAGVPVGTPYGAKILYGLTGATPGATPGPVFYATPSFVVGTVQPPLNSAHAAIWNSSGVLTDLHPTSLATFRSSAASKTDGTQEGGYGNLASSGVQDALLWTGSAASAVDLSPTNLTGFRSTAVDGVGGNEQVGVGLRGSGPTISHALLWSGSAASAFDLEPTVLTGFTNSQAEGTDGFFQVGEAFGANGQGSEHAILWSGTAASAVDLNPAKLALTFSSAVAVTNGEEVGYGASSSSNDVALLWKGTAASAVNLKPTDLGSVTYSVAAGTNGSQEVGSVEINGGLISATLWFGTANSAVNLQALLSPSGVWQKSEGDSIDSAGNVWGTAYGTYNGITETYAVEWSPVPEPNGFCFIVLAVAGLLGRRRSVDVHV